MVDERQPPHSRHAVLVHQHVAGVERDDLLEPAQPPLINYRKFIKLSSKFIYMYSDGSTKLATLEIF